MSTLVRNSIFMGLFNIFGRASGVIRYLLLVTLLPAGLYSIISYALHFGRLCRTFSDGGLDNLISRDGARNTERIPEYTFHGLFVKAVLSVVFLIGGFFYLTVVREKGRFELAVIYTALAGSILLSLTGALRSAFTAAERMEYVFYTNLPSRLISIATLAVTLYLGANLVISTAAISFENVLWFVLLGVVTVRFFPIRFKLSWKTLKYMISESWSLALYAFFNIFYLTLDVMTIDYLMGVDAVAPYTYASQLMEGLIMLASGYLIAVYPVLSRLHDDEEEYLKLFRRSVVVLLTVTVPVTTLFGVWSYGWMGLIPNNPEISGTVLALLSAALNVSIMNTLLIIVFTSRDRQRWLVAFTAGAVCVSFASNWVLIPMYDQAGAAMATLLSQIVLFSVMAGAARKLFNLKFPLIKPLGLIAASLASGFVVKLIPGVPLLAAPFLYGVLLVATALATGVVTRDEMMRLVKAVKK